MGAKPRQTTVIVMPNIGERFISPLRYFLERQTFKKEHFNCLPLRLGETMKGFVGQLIGFLHWKPRRGPEALRFINSIYSSFVVSVSDQEIVPTINASAVCI